MGSRGDVHFGMNSSNKPRRKRHPLARIKGGWTPAEDAELIRLVKELGEGNWSPISRALNQAFGKDESNGRIGKQCRERWNHHLRPDIRKDAWTREEEALLVAAHQELGNRWSDIAKTIPGRSENAVKNHWNASLRRRDVPEPEPGPLKVYMQSLNLVKPHARGRKSPGGGKAAAARRAMRGRKRGRDSESDITEEEDFDIMTSDEEEEEHVPSSSDDEPSTKSSSKQSGSMAQHKKSSLDPSSPLTNYGPCAAAAVAAATAIVAHNTAGNAVVYGSLEPGVVGAVVQQKRSHSFAHVHQRRLSSAHVRRQAGNGSESDHGRSKRSRAAAGEKLQDLVRLEVEEEVEDARPTPCVSDAAQEEAQDVARRLCNRPSGKQADHTVCPIPALVSPPAGPLQHPPHQDTNKLLQQLQTRRSVVTHPPVGSPQVPMMTIDKSPHCESNQFDLVPANSTEDYQMHNCPTLPYPSRSLTMSPGFAVLAGVLDSEFCKPDAEDHTSGGNAGATHTGNAIENADCSTGANKTGLVAVDNAAGNGNAVAAGLFDAEGEEVDLLDMLGANKDTGSTQITPMSLRATTGNNSFCPAPGTFPAPSGSLQLAGMSNQIPWPEAAPQQTQHATAPTQHLQALALPALPGNEFMNEYVNRSGSHSSLQSSYSAGPNSPLDTLHPGLAPQLMVAGGAGNAGVKLPDSNRQMLSALIHGVRGPHVAEAVARALLGNSGQLMYDAVAAQHAMLRPDHDLMLRSMPQSFMHPAAGQAGSQPALHSAAMYPQEMYCSQTSRRPRMHASEDGPSKVVLITTVPLPEVDLLVNTYMPPVAGLRSLRMGSKGPVRVKLQDLADTISRAGIVPSGATQVDIHVPEVTDQHVSANGDAYIGNAVNGVVRDLSSLIHYACRQIVQDHSIATYVIAVRLGVDTRQDEYSVLVAVQGLDGHHLDMAIGEISRAMAPLLC